MLASLRVLHVDTFGRAPAGWQRSRNAGVVAGASLTQIRAPRRPSPRSRHRAGPVHHRLLRRTGAQRGLFRAPPGPRGRLTRPATPTPAGYLSRPTATTASATDQAGPSGTGGNWPHQRPAPAATPGTAGCTPAGSSSSTGRRSTPSASMSATRPKRQTPAARAPYAGSRPDERGRPIRVFTLLHDAHAALIRPDGRVAWVRDGTHSGLEDALTRWFGPPAAAGPPRTSPLPGRTRGGVQPGSTRRPLM
jgi:hypothetical protein